MEKKYNDEIIDNLAEMTDTEIEELLGAGRGVVPTVTHECHMNSWQWFFGCCKNTKEGRGNRVTPRPPIS